MPCGRTQRRRNRRRSQQSASCSNQVNFQRWLGDQGFRNRSRLSPRVFPATGRGMVCGRRLRPGDVILSVPHRLLVTANVARATLSACPACHVASVADTEVSLALFLLHERLVGSASPWELYIGSLPQNFDCLVCWDEATIQFAPSDVRCRAQARWRSFQEMWRLYRSRVEQMLASHGHSTPAEAEERFMWAMCAVNTRCVYCKISHEPGESGATMVPFLDLLNHSPSARVTTAYEEGKRGDGCFVVKTLDEVSKGREAFICYGPHDNTFLLEEYGFVVVGNHHDSVPVSVESLAVILGIPEDSVERAGRQMDIRFIDGFCSSICILPQGPTYYMIILLDILVESSKNNTYNFFGKSETELQRKHACRCLSLVDHLSASVDQQLARLAEHRVEKFDASVNHHQHPPISDYRLDCLQRLLQGRDVILAECRRQLQSLITSHSSSANEGEIE